MFLFQHISCHNLDLLSNYTYVMLVEFLRLTNLSVYVKHWYGHKNESVDRIYKNLVQTCFDQVLDVDNITFENCDLLTVIHFYIFIDKFDCPK